MRILQAVSGYAAEGEEEGGEQEQGEAGGAMTAGGAPAVPAGRALEAVLGKLRSSARQEPPDQCC